MIYTNNKKTKRYKQGNLPGNPPSATLGSTGAPLKPRQGLYVSEAFTDVGSLEGEGKGVANKFKPELTGYSRDTVVNVREPVPKQTQ